MAGVRILPILFNTDMVCAILEDRKTVTRRVVKYQPDPGTESEPACEIRRSDSGRYKGEWHLYRAVPLLDPANKSPWGMQYIPPYLPGDILYVRETWTQINESIGMGLSTKKYIYRANYSDAEADGLKWRPSIHMSKEAARIWLRVTDVRAERLHEITDRDAEKEGVGILFYEAIGFGDKDYGCMTYSDSKGLIGFQREQFAHLWDSTLKPLQVETLGWSANPWVWRTQFERCEKPEG